MMYGMMLQNKETAISYAISTKNLAQYLEWVQREGWHPIRLEDVWLARQGKKNITE